MPGMLIEGKWTDEWKERNPTGQYNPEPTMFRNTVTTDSANGFEAETERYHRRFELPVGTSRPDYARTQRITAGNLCLVRWKD